MKVTLVRPNMGRLAAGAYVDEGRMEPLPLGVLAALTPPDVECVLYDDRIEPIPYDEPTDLVGITLEIFTARRAYEIAAEYRRRGVPVVLGGFHPTLVPDEALQHADAICRGDAETVWARIVADARRGRLERVYRVAPGGTPQAGGVLPRRELYRGKGYLPVALLQFGRGCRFACNYCAIGACFEHTHAARPTRDVLAEIEAQEHRTLFFVDDNFVADRAAAKAFLRELAPLRVRWMSQASIDMTEDPELMDLMEASGCLGHVIGFESVVPAALRGMDKRQNLLGATWDRYEAACQVLRRHHLQTWAAFLLGSDEDTPASIRATLEFAMRQKFCFAAFNLLMPYPGTPLYDRLRGEGRLLYDGQWWLHPDYRFNHAAFVPRHLGADELTAAGLECRRRWNRPAAIFERLWDPSTHLSSPRRLGIYLAYTGLFAREALRKQGLLLGLFRESVGPRHDAAARPPARSALGAGEP